MLCKLSVSNIKRSFKDYAIYFITLVLGVCIFYIFNSIDSQTAMLKLTRERRNIIVGLKEFLLPIMSVFVSIILGCLIIYASRFLMKKRNKEFGIYMILGMSKRKISMLLILEMFIIGLISLATGLVLGVVLSQITSIFVADMFEVNMTNFVFNFSKSAMMKTIIYFGIIYFVVMILNTLIINKNKLINLFQAGKKQEDIKTKNPVVCIILFLLSIVMLSVAYYLVTAKVDYILSKVMSKKFDVLLTPIILGILGTLLFFYSVAGMLLKILSKCHNLYNRNLNTFVIRQISSKINTVVIAMSIICIILFTTFCLLSSSLTIKNAFSDGFNKYNPVDFELVTYGDMDYNEVIKNNKIKDAIIVRRYIAEGFERSADTATNQHIFYNDEGMILPQSDYNKLAKLFKFDTIKLNKDEYAVVANVGIDEHQKKIDADYGINVFGKDLKPYKKVVEGFLHIINIVPSNRGFFVVNDDVVKNEEICERVIFGNYNSDDEEEKEAIEKEVKGIFEGMLITRSGNRKAVIIFRVLATFVGIYLGIVFLISAASVLALKELSDCIDDKNKYRILRQIGVSEKLINKALYKQTFIFYILPLGLASIHTIFGLKFCKSVLKIASIENMMSGSIITFLFLLAIYVTYFTATYLCNKNIINSR